MALSILIVIIEFVYFFAYPVIVNYTKPPEDKNNLIEKIDITAAKTNFAKLEELQDRKVDINEPVEADDNPFSF